ncbi:choline kinase cytoplasm [Trametopsis cervina]|nr:choline kinase cytoplasm [Trametopsis cervina]
MSPPVAADLPPLPPFSDRGRPAVPFSAQRASSGSAEHRQPISRSSSSASIPFDDDEVDVVRVEGLRHAHIRLEARRYKSAAFAEDLLNVLRSLKLHPWNHADITSQALKIQKVSGSLTNAVFFVSCPSAPILPTLLLRIYGPSSGALISRPRELHILHALSSRYHIGPRVYGTFENGRVEEFFESTTLTARDLRNPKISSWIGARMAELHDVDIAVVELQSPPATPTFEESSDVTTWPIAVTKNVKSWLLLAREVLTLPTVSEELRSALDLDRFKAEWDQYIRWLGKNEKELGSSPVVFAHNDTQYGNLLRLAATPKEAATGHRQIIVVDFEYASPNPAAFDIANHFHEWTADYHSDVPHLLRPDRYPTVDERYNFYRSYLAHHQHSCASSADEDSAPEPVDVQLSRLDSQVRAWSPSSHAMWALWGLVQAREALEGKDSEPEFDYVAYSQCRMESFRRELKALLA